MAVVCEHVGVASDMPLGKGSWQQACLVLLQGMAWHETWYCTSVDKSHELLPEVRRSVLRHSIKSGRVSDHPLADNLDEIVDDWRVYHLLQSVHCSCAWPLLLLSPCLPLVSHDRLCSCPHL